jgi:hypothetical protein
LIIHRRPEAGTERSTTRRGRRALGARRLGPRRRRREMNKNNQRAKTYMHGLNN